jgi:hypothetical protein
MSRNAQGQYARPRSTGFIIFTWLCGFLSVGLLYLAARAVVSNFASLRSCDVNSSGLAVSSCGKAALNVTDIMMIGLFMLIAVLVVTLFTAAIRMTRRSRA